VLEQSRHSGGLVEVSVNVPTSGSGPILVIALWHGQTDYQRWLTNPARAAFIPRLAAVLEREPAAGDMYEIRNELRG